jgi:hypothetical protein
VSRRGRGFMSIWARGYPATAADAHEPSPAERYQNAKPKKMRMMTGTVAPLPWVVNVGDQQAFLRGMAGSAGAAHTVTIFPARAARQYERARLGR